MIVKQNAVVTQEIAHVSLLTIVQVSVIVRVSVDVIQVTAVVNQCVIIAHLMVKGC